MLEVTKREKEAGIVPDPDIDTYMKVLKIQLWCPFSCNFIILHCNMLMKMCSCNVDNYSSLLQAISVDRLEKTLQTDYILKVILINRADIVFLYHIHRMFHQLTNLLISLLFRFLDLIPALTQWLEMP